MIINKPAKTAPIQGSLQGSIIKQWSYIFGSRTKAQEIVLLLQDAKKVVRHGFYDHELPKVQKFCEENKLHCIVSNFKVLMAEEEGYSNLGFRVKGEDKRPGMQFVYISKDEKDAWLASYYELMKNDRDLGLVLGYPQCCVDFFCQNFNRNNADLQLKPTNIYTNMAQRKKDCVLISHFPCSSECQKSMEIGRKNLMVINSVDKERSRELQSVLNV